MNMKEVIKKWTGCQCCELSESRNKQVFFRGREGARVMIIGEAPGADEDLEGKPFVGRAGRVLDKVILAANLSNDVFITNILSCRPPGNRVPTGEEAKACNGRLVDTFKAARPKAVLLVGGTAAGRLCGVKQVGAWRGQRLYVELMDCQAVPAMVTWHPSYYLRQGSKASIFNQMVLDLERVYKLSGA